MSSELIELNSRQGRLLGEWGQVEAVRGWTRQAAVENFCEAGLAILDQIEAEFAGLINRAIMAAWRQCYEDSRRMNWTLARQLITDIGCYTENLVRRRQEVPAAA